MLAYRTEIHTNISKQAQGVLQNFTSVCGLVTLPCTRLCNRWDRVVGCCTHCTLYAERLLPLPEWVCHAVLKYCLKTRTGKSHVVRSGSI